ncbi:hypothetical protein NDU88_006512 [Pleurodeles waltl]|uniref:Uncharacterized protein n=1 Tax=Pleurodeles waltl TaxID=8319 RepID=A0AAV7SPU0_PLEWA|nr:hypothetical protein NDU88_006512 [Pleurodeles waltl]
MGGAATALEGNFLTLRWARVSAEGVGGRDGLRRCRAPMFGVSPVAVAGTEAADGGWSRPPVCACHVPTCFPFFSFLPSGWAVSAVVGQGREGYICRQMVGGACLRTRRAVCGGRSTGLGGAACQSVGAT